MGDSFVQRQNRTRDEIAKTHLEKMAKNQNEMRKAGKNCDCTLEVTLWRGKVSSQVNYAVVSAASEYCRSNSRCNNRKWTVEMFVGGRSHETETMKEALEQCIEFMYVGKADIRDNTAKCITILSHILQLKSLEDLGLETMHDNLTTCDNCYKLLPVARYCKRREYEAEAIKKWISLNLQQIQRLNECSAENLWRSAAYLFQNSEHFSWWCKMLDALKVIEIKKADLDFLLNVIMTNEKVTKDSAAAKYVFKTIWHKINREPSNLNCRNYYKVKNLLPRYGSDDTSGLKVRLQRFMINNFDVLAQQDGFLETNQDEVTTTFSSPQLTCTEKTKFDCMVKWAKHEPEERAQTFPQLFKLIKLEKLSEEELIDIKKDPLVESNASLVSSVFDALAKKRETLSQLHDLPYTAQWLLTQLQTQECDNGSIASSRSQRTRTSKSRKLPSKVSNFSTASFSQHTTSQISNFSTASLREDLLSLETSSDTEAEVYDRAYFSEESDN